MASWTEYVPRIVDGQPVNAATANAPLDALSQRTQALREQVQEQQASWALRLRGLALADTALDGMLVYYDSELAVWRPALAIWQDLVGTDGALTPAFSAFYGGLVVDRVGSVGDLVTNGFVVLTDTQILNLFGEAAPDAGIYYLSTGTEGTVAATVSGLRMRALIYHGGGLVQVLPPQHEHVTHRHHEYLLSSGAANWLDPATPGAPVPDGAVYWYNHLSATALAQNLAEAFLPTEGDAVCVQAGAVLPDASVLVNDDGIWWMVAGAVPATDIRMWTTMPVAHEAPIIHTASSANAEVLGVSIVGGRLVLTPQDNPEETGTGSGTAIESITGGAQVKVPVVNGITTGLGLRSWDAGAGVKGLAVDTFGSWLLSADVTELNNAVTSAVLAPMIMIEFPAGRSSSINCRVMIPPFDSTVYSLRMWAVFRGNGTAMAAPTGSLLLIKGTTGDVEETIPSPLAVTLVGNTPALTTKTVMRQSADLDLTALGIEDGLTEGAAVFYTLSASSPAAAIRLLNTGLILVPVS